MDVQKHSDQERDQRDCGHLELPNRQVFIPWPLGRRMKVRWYVATYIPYEACGKPGAENATWEAVRNTKGSKHESWSYSRGVGGPRWLPPGHLYSLPGGNGLSSTANTLAVWIHPLRESKHALTLCGGQIVSKESVGQKRLTLSFQLLHKSTKVAFG